jgi:hypothetical protein
MQTPPSGGCGFSLVNFAEDGFCQSIASTDDLEPRTALPESASLQAKKGTQQPEDALHFRGRSAPVVGRKGVYRKAADPNIRRALDNAPQSGHSGAMTGDAGQSAPHRPTAISVHDDGHM